MRGWTVQIDRRALAQALWQPAMCIAFVAAIGLFIPRAALDEFLWVGGIIVAVFLVIFACQFIGAGAQVAIRGRGVSQSADQPSHSAHQPPQLELPHGAAGSSRTDGLSG